MPRVEFAILGAGAIGSIIAAHLARAGHDVALLARGRRAAQVASEGLRIEGLVEFTVPIPVIVDPGELSGAETLIVATKAIATAAALAPLQRTAIGAALSIQNGLVKNELLGAAFGAERVLGAVANTSGELLPSGAVLFTRNVNVLLGEPGGGMSERALRVARSLDAAGVRAFAADDIQSQEWTKFAAWVGLMTLAVVTRRPTWQYLCQPGAALVVVRLVREVGRLAAARGVALVDDPAFPMAAMCRASEEQAVELALAMGRVLREKAPAHRVSALQDLEAGRPLEIDETLGYAVQMAGQIGLDLPLLSNFYHLISAIDAARDPRAQAVS